VSQRPDLVDEHRLWRRGCARIAGIDEAGRGAWAGPVVAAAVILPRIPDLRRLLDPVRDSKLLTPAQRERCYTLVLRYAVAYGIGAAPPEVIDHLGIVPATRQAMLQAVAGLGCAPDGLIIDALALHELPIPQLAIAKADLTCLSVAAASILAKVTRDRMMVALDAELPQYGLAAHKGYGTRRHREALHTYGPTDHHRRTFAPISLLLHDDDD
jgi:ribonuclease HII